MASDKLKDGVPGVLIIPTPDGAVAVEGTFHASAGETGKPRYKGKTIMINGVFVKPEPEPAPRVPKTQQELFPWLKIPGAKKEYVN